MCGFFGILGPEGKQVISLLYDGLIAIQHRGQDAAGIATYDKELHLIKNNGFVRDVFTEESIKTLTGHIGIGHVRYPTIGKVRPEDAHPFTILAPLQIALAHNGQIVNFQALKQELLAKGHCFQSSGNDAEILLYLLIEYLPKNRPLTFEDCKAAITKIQQKAIGGYSVIVFIEGLGLLAFRDSFGIRPLVVGQTVLNDTTYHLIGSESVVLDLAGAQKVENLAPGELYLVDLKQQVFREVLVAKEHRPCIFEYIYFARPDSVLDQVSVYDVREKLGEKLAEAWLKNPLPLDVIIPVPDSSRPAALAMARKLNVPYCEGLVKNRYIGRTFIMPNDNERQKSLHHKLNVVKSAFEGKNVLLVDDSIVRGNTVKQLVQISRLAGAKAVYFASYSAPLRYPCVYGIDMSTKKEFIAHERTIPEIQQEIGADYLLYQDFDEMVKAAQSQKKLNFCTACFTNNYPTAHDLDNLEDFEIDRSK